MARGILASVCLHAPCNFSLLFVCPYVFLDVDSVCVGEEASFKVETVADIWAGDVQVAARVRIDAEDGQSKVLPSRDAGWISGKAVYKSSVY